MVFSTIVSTVAVNMVADHVSIAIISAVGVAFSEAVCMATVCD